METTSFKCLKCGWTGYQPLCQRVSSGHSSWPVRDICPDCFEQKRGSFTVTLARIVPVAIYSHITDENKRFYISEAATLLNFPRIMSYYLFRNLDNYISLADPVVINGQKEWNMVRKKDLDALIKKING